MGLRDISRKGNYGGPVSTGTILIAVTGYDIQDPHERTPNLNGQDRIRGLLLRDACGLTAEFDDNGPVTEVAIVLDNKAPAVSKDSPFARPEVMDKYKGKKFVEVDGIVAGDQAEVILNKAGELPVIQVHWLNTFTPKNEPETQFVSPNKLVEISRENNKRDKPGQTPRPGAATTTQHAVIVEETMSVKFADVDSFKKAAVELLTWAQYDTDLPNMPGNVGLRIRAVETNPETGELYADYNDFSGSYDSAAGRVRTPAEMVDAFMAESADWMGEIERNGAVTHFEVMPMCRVYTGAQSLPTAKAVGKAGKVAADFDDGLKLCAYPVETDRGTSLYTGMIRADVMSQRIKSPRPDPVTGKVLGPWFRSNVAKINTGKIYARAEFPSAVLPKEIADVFEERAKARSKDMNAFREAKKKEAANPEEAPEESSAPRP